MSQEQTVNTQQDNIEEIVSTTEQVIDNELHDVNEDVLSDELESAQSSEEATETIEESELTQLQQRNAQLEEQLLRLQAEIQNMRRIHTREKQDAAKFRSQNLATSLLDVADNLERALSTQPTNEEAQSLHKGVEMVYNQFVSAFEKENIQVINPLGESFDPNYHQAVSVMPAEDGQETDKVMTVLQKGYVLNERVLRPAMVIVSQ